jgi:hypothetical protein
VCAALAREQAICLSSTICAAHRRFCFSPGTISFIDWGIFFDLLFDGFLVMLLVHGVRFELDHSTNI